MSTTNTEVLRLTEAMTTYYFFIESCSQCIRTIPQPKGSLLYKEAVQTWQQRSELYRPPRGNEAERAKFFAAVDKVCRIESRTPENCYLIIFACTAAIRVVIGEDFMKLSDSDRNHVLNESRRLSMERLGFVVPDMTSVRSTMDDFRFLRTKLGNMSISS